ncbi:hypothetical protein, partial [Yersinia massiliensis]|uniref:hypothetical protein n=1 Tax=Yersinia massiliensis TaxID=419257 RepID=UPI0018C8CEE0
ITAPSGQNVITGSGTQWANNVMGVAIGQALYVTRTDGNTLVYEILAVDSDTKIRINGNIVDSLTNSNYAIHTTVSNSYSALARESSAQLGFYQQLFKDWQSITTSSGNVTIIAPDGSTVVIPSLTQMSQDINGKVSQQQLSNIGVGLPTLVGLTALDWQQQDFMTGANYISSNNVWTNTPAGVSYNAGTGVSITIDYISSNSTRIGFTLVPDTTLATNFRVYKILSVGAKGSRVFTVREELTSANPVPIAGGGTGSNTLSSAQSALGIVADAFGASQVANTAWINATLQNGWSAASGGRAVYRKVLGIVFIHLNLVPGTATDGTVLFTLPDGYRPAFATSLLSFAASSSAPLPARVNIQPNGQVTITQTAATYGVTIMSSFTIQ